MGFPIYSKHILFYNKALRVVLVLCFILFNVVEPVVAQIISGQSFGLTSSFDPPVLKGMTVHAENPLLFDFIVDRGQDKINGDLLKDESTKLIKYFLTSMTIPDKDAWVNLSPYEKDRIIPDALGQTEMGKVMLEQDYVLKQLAASLTNPETELGKRYWDEVNKRNIAVGNGRDRSLQNKVWIVPDGATVVEKDGFAYITESKLTVMLDEDYQAVGPYCNTPLQKNTGSSAVVISTAVFRQMILPKLVEEVNMGKNFAATRQVYQSVILAAWYKRALKDSLLGKVYMDKSKVVGVETDVKDIKQRVYEQYLEGFKKGAYNIIKEENGVDGELIPRKYFSGGQKMGKAEVELNVISSSSVTADVLKELLSGFLLKHADFVFVSFLLSILKVEGIETIPSRVKLKKIISSAVLDITGFKIDNFEGIEDAPLRFLILNNSYEDKRKFSELTHRLQSGQRQDVEDQILNAVNAKAKSPFSSEDQEYVRRIIGNLLNRVENLDMFWTSLDRVTIKFEHYKGSYIGQDSEILSKTMADLINKKLVSGEGKEIVVERIAPEDDTKPGQLIHPGQHTYLVKWGSQQYNIKVGSNNQPISPRLQNQATILEYLNSNGGNSHISKLLFSGVVQDHTVIVMTHMKGKSLQERIDYDENPFSYEDSIEFARELAKAVKFVHDKGVIIADLTPGNILVWREPATEKIKVFLFDFDVSIIPGYDWNHDPSQLSDEKSQLIRISQRKAFDELGELVDVDMKNLNSRIDIVYFGKALFAAMTSEGIKSVGAVTSKTIRNDQLRKIIVKSLKSYGLEGNYEDISEVLKDLDALPDNLSNDQGWRASASVNVDQSPDRSVVGGIDFDSSKLNLQIERDKYGTPINLPQPNLEHMDNIQGLYPVMINIAPVNSRTLPILGQLQPSAAAAVPEG